MARKSKKGCHHQADRLLFQLKHGSVVERAEAAQRIAELSQPSRQHAEVLSEALSDDSMWVRSAVAETLGKLGPLAEPFVPALAAALRCEQATHSLHVIVAKACEELGIFAASAADVLAEMALPSEMAGGNVPHSVVDTLRLEMKGASLRALAKVGDAALPHLDMLLQHVWNARQPPYYDSCHQEFGRLAASTIGAFGPAAGDRAAKALADTVVDESCYLGLRLSAVDAFGKLGDSACMFARDVMCVLEANSADSRLRLQIATALAGLQLPPGPVRESLATVAAEALTFPVREAAANALKSIEARERVRVLTCCIASRQSDDCALVCCTSLAGETLAVVPCSLTSSFASLRASIAESLGASAAQLRLVGTAGNLFDDADLIHTMEGSSPCL